MPFKREYGGLGNNDGCAALIAGDKLVLPPLIGDGEFSSIENAMFHQCRRRRDFAAASSCRLAGIRILSLENAA